nr:acyl-CoA carboxylase subunit beta [uncultured Oscillibacter sp.]
MWDKSRYQKLYDLQRQAAAGGGPVRVRRQHSAGKLTARERLEILFDPGTFVELGGLIESRITDCGMDAKRIPGDGVITGYGKIGGRLACASSEDFTVIGGTLGEAHAEKICAIQDLAMEMRVPIILINDSGGARIEEGVCSLSGYSGMFLRNTRASGVVPQIAAVMGPCAGGACYSPAICDFVFMVEGSSYMFITGPQVVKAVTGGSVSAEELGGARVHMTESGVAHFSCRDERSCLEAIRDLLSYLPQNSGDRPPVGDGVPVDRSDEIEGIVPQNPRKPYDVREVVRTMADEGSFLEIQAGWATNAVVGLARMDGRTVGFVANQPASKSGSLDRDSSDKMARFIRTCDCFGVPLVVLIDVPAFLPGTEQEHSGIIRHGAKLLYAFSEATVPKISLIMRKAYGGAYIAMNSKRMGADMVFAWPIAEVAVMGAEGAVEILHRRELDLDPSCRERLTEEYRTRYMDPYLAAARGHIDAVIEPEDTRRRIASALEALAGKPRGEMRHGNIPL